MIIIAGIIIEDNKRKKEYFKKSTNGQLLKELEQLIHDSKIIKKDKKMILKSKKTPLTIVADGESVCVETQLTFILRMKKNKDKFPLLCNSEIEKELELFMPKLEKIYDEINEKYIKEFGTADNHFNSLVEQFKKDFYQNIAENIKYEIKSGMFSFRYAKSEGIYMFQIWINDDVVWECQIENNKLEIEMKENPKQTNITEEKVKNISSFQEKMEEIKLFLTKKMKIQNNIITNKMKEILEITKANEEQYKSIVEKANSIYDLYLNLSEEVKREKEEEIMILLEEVKQQIHKEKAYLKI